MDRRLGVQWLNRGNLAHKRIVNDIQSKRLPMHFVSNGARDVLEGRLSAEKLLLHHEANCIGKESHVFFKDRPLMKDHAVPVKVLFEELARLPRATSGEIEGLLLERYRLGLITQCENNRFRRAKLISKMPGGQKHWLSRYEHELVDIKGEICLKTGCST